MSFGTADQSKPFVLNITLGEFLRGTSTLFITIALMFSFLEYFDMKIESNTIVFTMLVSAVVINVLLELNSKIMFAIVAFLTLSSVVGQLIVSVNLLLNSKNLKVYGMTETTLILTCVCVMAFVSILLIVQLTCSAALFKLSGLFDGPEPVKAPPVELAQIENTQETEQTEQTEKTEMSQKPPKTLKKARKAKKAEKTVESVESACRTANTSNSDECTFSDSEETTR